MFSLWLFFLQIGELFEHYAEARILFLTLLDIRPDSANVIKKGEIIVTNPANVAIGETILVKPGEKIPLDGEIIEGNSSAVALTGESIPKRCYFGRQCCIRVREYLWVIENKGKCKTFNNSTASKNYTVSRGNK